MKGKEEYTNKLAGLANKLKTEQVKTPLQEVRPIAASVRETTKEKGTQLNVWIPNELMKAVKLHGLEHKLSLKEITTKALEQYLK